MAYQFKLFSSLEKIFFDDFSDLKEHTSGSMLKNEIYSFQLAGFAPQRWNQKIQCKLEIESELAPYIEVKQIGYVPSMLPTIRKDEGDDYLTKTPGYFPDPLFSLKDNVIELACCQARAFWISVEPKGQITGIYPIVLKVFGEKGHLLEELCFTLEIIDAQLPKQVMYNTCWLHGDCLASLHHVEMQSEEYFTILEKYLEVYAKFGHNMILTPVFTPPLDTEVGGERPTNQLVDVYKNGETYRFEFSKLQQWIDLCHKYGIEYFEISHLFTQWGAKYAPKIMATVEGIYQKLFGWDTEALSEEYQTFLIAFLEAFTEFLKKEGIFENCFFHVSDEPEPQHEEQYRAVKAVLLRYIKEEKLIDALSAYSFYEKGIVKNPIVANDHIHTFIEHGIKDLWTYYCCAQYKEVANRFMAMPSHRNRILGYQLYKYQIRGFLQWGYNFWYKQYSKGVIDPYVDTTSGGGFPSGDAYVVYPLDENGEVVCSLRLYVFYEGLQDMRALELLESLIGREEVEALLEDVDGFKVYPRNSAYILNLREKVNQLIKSALNK